MSSKRSKKDGDTKAEGSSDKKTSKSKKKEKSSKESKEVKEPKEKVSSPAIPTPGAPPATIVEQPEINDPDAIQLFRRYDREKANHITRSDFLDLLRDYTAWYPGRKWNMPVMPCALTDAAGIPLGFERTSRNSEFEAGQLFERYDTNRSGTLEATEFQLFFRDFKKQLGPFVEEMLAAFHATSPPRPAIDSSGAHYHRPQHTSASPPPWQAPSSHPTQRVADTRHLYETKLTQLRALCDVTLQQLHDKLDNLQHHRHAGAPAWSTSRAPPAMMHEEGRDRREWKRHQSSSRSDEIAIDALKKDMDFVDRVFKDTSEFLDQQHRVSPHDMNAFLDDFPRVSR
ncbi:hypothetical protein, variant 2 [Aphanomyces invadans]|uniref:EF-hand domain-containing protein n=1 Tax=Aphanomyces invadans TaxID=157072 RepID=A0A024UT27_9STRA|nr:hypothetical protein, variant 1 [Aphanomyces invadans]XP_008860895.1 hypothetical protein, variant 2 [Aphanomyces invadans]ETW09483.1 hypothetical protein, variant 1 [Aphanomyces invadans]ETW09484.1 hypothetical protein, variant 2 [Aphanomyces invadans]|eukprot:XP_008860894.1 hypothetical protein, variant 1 [Aphanomyces invadans]